MVNMKKLTKAVVAMGVLCASGAASAAHEQGDSTFVPTVMPEMRFAKLMVDRLEYAWGDDEDTLNWDAKFWYGGDYNRLVIETEGEDIQRGGSGGEVESFDVMYSRMIDPYWSIQGGLGYQRHYGPGPDHDRGYAVLSLHGLAPYWFETDATLRAYEGGGVAADVEFEYEWLLTQRLILQPRFSTLVSSEAAEDFGIGQGLNYAQIGLRLRYEFRREFAPYIGVYYNRKFGDTADLAEAEGEDTSGTFVVAGVRIWF